MAWYCAIDIVQPQIDTDHRRIFVRKPKYIKPTSYIGKNKIIQALDDIAAVLSGSSAVVRDYTYTDMQPNILIDQGKKPDWTAQVTYEPGPSSSLLEGHVARQVLGTRGALPDHATQCSPVTWRGDNSDHMQEIACAT